MKRDVVLNVFGSEQRRCCSDVGRKSVPDTRASDKARHPTVASLTAVLSALDDIVYFALYKCAY